MNGLHEPIATHEGSFAETNPWEDKKECHLSYLFLFMMLTRIDCYVLYLGLLLEH